MKNMDLFIQQCECFTSLPLEWIYNMGCSDSALRVGIINILVKLPPSYNILGVLLTQLKVFIYIMFLVVKKGILCVTQVFGK